MGTITQSYTEQDLYTGSTKAVHTFTWSANDITVSGDTYTLPNVTVGAKYNTSADGRTHLYENVYFYYGRASTSNRGAEFFIPKSAITANTVRSETFSFSSAQGTQYAFNQNNPNDRSVPLHIYLYHINGYTGNASGDIGNLYILNEPRPGTDIGAVCNLVLDAPPTFDTTQVSFDTNYVYAGLTTASVTVSNLSAKYGGNISSAVLTIGNQTATRTTNGALSILLDTVGTFTPTVTVTDSRGQVTTTTLTAITVNGYTAPSVAFDVERTLDTGVEDDEGTYAVIDATLTFTDVIATAQAPTVTVTDQDGITTTATVTWYSARASDGTLSGTVTWANLSSGDTVHGLISGFSTQYSYQITVTPADDIHSGTAITQTLGSAFYTVDFLAGGHGIAFGQPASQTGFYCSMDAHFVDDAHFESDVYFADHASVMRVLFDFVYPIGSYYETSDTTFNPNTTWGGTWVLEAEGQVHVSAGTNYAIAGALTNTSDGGSKDAIIPYHYHSVSAVTNAITGGSHTHVLHTKYKKTCASGTSQNRLDTDGTSNTTNSGWNDASTHTHNLPAHNTNYAGTDGNTVGANMQPYIVVNRWHRTA